MAEDEQEFRHESFGFIRASRVSGNAALFDSALRQQHYVSITIGEAYQKRHLSREWNHTGKELITVALSEAQFAQFITSMNVGSGAPCTIQRLAGKGVESPPVGTNRRETFEEEARKKAEEAVAGVDEAAAKLKALLGKGKAGKAELQELSAAIGTARQQLVSNLPFVLTSFAEAVENITERAKMDLNAHALLLGQRVVVSDENGRLQLEHAEQEDLPPPV